MRIGVLASGRGSNLQAILDAIQQGRLQAEVAVVICDNPGALALERAAQCNIPAILIERKKFVTPQEFEAAIADRLRHHRVEWVILAGFMRILSGFFINQFPQRIVNIHPALLPAFPGLHAQRQALEYGVKISGCTVHFVDEGVDSGPILLQKAVPVYETDTEVTLAERILHVEHELYPQALQLLSTGSFHIEGRSVHTGKIANGEGKI